MAKASGSNAAGAMKHKTSKSQQQQQHKGKPGKAQQQAKSKPGKPAAPHQQHQQQHKSKQPHAGANASPASAAVQSVVAKMTDESVSWFDVVKPLKELKVEPSAALANVPGAKGNSRKKNKKLQQLALAKATSGAAVNPLDADAAKLSEAQIESKKRQAQQLLDDEVRRFETKKSSKMSSDDKYLATMMKNGTLADRVAALTLTIQSSPFHCLSRLGQLITMASKKARRESMMAVDSLKDLFINNLLPDDRRLRFFHQNPLHHPDVTDAHLVVWFYEHCLKTAFAQLVGVLASGMDDAVDNHKRACIRAANALLAAKPEQEAVLLAMLVNKLGDPDRKIASYIHKTLQELLQEHPVMKRVVIDEVERVLTRPQVSDRTKYNAILFLNQIYLDKSGDDADLATHLITVYFGLFTKEVHAHDDVAKTKTKSRKKTAKRDAIAADGMDRKLLSALLVGVNRAFPYAKATSAQFHHEIDALFTVVHRAHHSTSVQALMLLFQVMNSTNSVSDRFYTALYDKLFDPKVRETTKHTLFLNLIFRAMKADVSPARNGAMMKRLLQLTTVMTPAFTCAVLFLLSELLKLKPTLRTLLDQPESGASARSGDDDEHFEDAKASSEDEDDEAPTTFAPEDSESDEEATDNDDEAPAPELNDGLTDAERTQKVLEGMFGKAPVMKTTKTATPVSFDESDDDEDSNDDAAPKPATSQPSTDAVLKDSYDPRKRNPLYANADKSCAWELHHLVHHYHPSVQMFARQLLTNQSRGIEYAGDPLVDFTMLAFFEKFMNKKPRHKIEASSGAKKSWSFAPINSEALLEEAEENVDESDKFFYKFFKERAVRAHDVPALQKKAKAKASKKARGDDDRDADAFSDFGSDEDEEFEAYAQELAEGIMKDGDLDDEDPDMGDWSDGDDDDNDDGGELDGEDDDEDEDGASGEFGDDLDDDSDDGGELDGEDDDGSDDDDDEDGFDFAGMDGIGASDDDDDDDNDEEEEPEPAKSKKKTPPAPKRKSPFASADDYDEMVQQALAKQAAARSGSKHKKQKRN